MPTKEQIRQALTEVIDPELNKNIVEAGMVREIQVEDGELWEVTALPVGDLQLVADLCDRPGWDKWCRGGVWQLRAGP